MSQMRLLKINKTDDVAIALDRLSKGDIVSIDGIKLEIQEQIEYGHKVALRNINEGEPVIKYGQCIGFAKKYITNGEHVHTHNLRTSLGKLLNYTYNPKKHEIIEKHINCGTFEGYVRHDGRVGVRNEVWIIPTVGCVNGFIRKLCAEAQKEFGGLCDSFAAFEHPYGCSQLGDDQKNTQKVLSSLVNHPNAGAVLIVSLGCENNNLNEFLPLLGEYDKERVKTLTIQSCTDEFQAGMKLLSELAEYAGRAKRTKVSSDNLVVGLKCGGSDAFSGITANPLCGCFTDKLIKCGGTVLQTEVPEMFGAEQLLMDRAVDEQTFEKIVLLINDFKKYYISHNQPVYENPSPGNKEGGITTLEEKSLGCVQKSGTSPVRDVLPYAKPWTHKGLNLVYGPGNDIVSATNLVAAGAQIILFTTGRGTPLGAPVPAIKISSNTALFQRKPDWIDYNAGQLMEGRSFDDMAYELFSYVLDIASGKVKTNNEKNGYRDLGIFKGGVTL